MSSIHIIIVFCPYNYKTYTWTQSYLNTLKGWKAYQLQLLLIGLKASQLPEVTVNEPQMCSTSQSVAATLWSLVSPKYYYYSTTIPLSQFLPPYFEYFVQKFNEDGIMVGSFFCGTLSKYASLNSNGLSESQL